ncbi:unnamed protein product [Orchesella dallaii]|uniref:Uncharacterized protein n=1 Tax=Orchesella dallaii TaxID=48710 RepID=A0ABP1Q2N5_9HEXA
MNRESKVGPSSIYSHSQTALSVGLSSAKSVKSLLVPWYKRPVITNLFGIGIQKLSLFTSIYSIFLSLFTMTTSSFDLYCLDMAAPGSTHYGYYMFSFDFVYVGNRHVRNALVAVAIFSIFGASVLFATSIMLLNAMRSEYERKMKPWLICMMTFATWRLLAFIFCAVVNDMIFAYNIMMCFLSAVFTVLNYIGWVAVYSFFLELCDLTKLEDLAYLRMGTMTSIRVKSIPGSCPTTPHSMTSTVV